MLSWRRDIRAPDVAMAALNRTEHRVTPGCWRPFAQAKPGWRLPNSVPIVVGDNLPKLSDEDSAD
jgi:hypothetical protein